MNLIKQREAFFWEFMRGQKPKGVLEDYRKNRNSEDWRTGLVVEELCEYILYLEGKLEELE